MADFKKAVPPKGVLRPRRNWRAIILTICAMICGTVFISCCALAVIVASVLSGICPDFLGIGAGLLAVIIGCLGAVVSDAGALVFFLTCLVDTLPMLLYLLLYLCFADYLEIAVSWLQILGIL